MSNFIFQSALQFMNFIGDIEIVGNETCDLLCNPRISIVTHENKPFISVLINEIQHEQIQFIRIRFLLCNCRFYDIEDTVLQGFKKRILVVVISIVSYVAYDFVLLLLLSLEDD